MIVVTGANGAFGREVVERLLTRTPAEELVASVRDPSASPFAARGVAVRLGNFDRPDTLAAAFEGAETVLINGTNYGTAPADRGRQRAAAIGAALGAGVRRIVVASMFDLGNRPPPFAADYPETEKLVAASAAEWTILRLTYGMAASLARDVLAAERAGELTAPAGEAHAAPAAAADLAEATAAVLAEPGHAARTYELSGPDAIDWNDLAALASERAGRPIVYRPVFGDEFAAKVAADGWPPAAVAALLDYYAAFRAGWANKPTPDLAALLGRRPTSSLNAVRAAL